MLFKTTVFRGSRNLLANGWNNLNGVHRSGSGCTGASAQNLWEAKTQWIDDWAPNTTIYKGIVDDPSASTWYRGTSLSYGIPTFEWLFQELQHGEDVEIWLQLKDEAHMVTLTGLGFRDDGTVDDMWNPQSEVARIFWLDPNLPDQELSARLYKDVNDKSGYLKFLWDDHANPAEFAWITLGYSESPVPEPAAFIPLSAVVCIVLIGLRWRKRNRVTN